MTPERWQQIEHLLHAALECEPAGRAAFLDRECADDASPARRGGVAARLRTSTLTAFLVANALEDAAVLLEDADSDGSMIGRHVGPYSIQKQLGSGGMGEVYLAQDVRLGRNVALKLLDPGLTGDSTSRTRFIREARLASALDHVNICTIHEVGEAGGRLFIAMQHVEGETLRKVIDGRPLNLDSLLSISLQVADALAAAHARGIIHRDIKAGNIIITPRGQAKVLDFGIAKLLEQGEGVIEVEVTATGQMLGTPSAMSPEQVRGREVDARTDIWSLGVVLYEMVTGRAPFEGETAGDVIALVLQKEPPPLSHYAPEAPAGLQRIISKALRKSPDERYQTVGEMLSDLREVKRETEIREQTKRPVERDANAAHATATEGRGEGATAAASGGGITTRNASSAEYLVGEIKRHRKGAALTAVALVIALIFFGIWFYRLASRSGPEQAARTSGPTAPFQTMKITRLTTVGTAASASVSPDGKYIVYATGEAVVPSGYWRRWTAGRTSLWVKQISTDRAVELIPPADVQYRGTTFSRDGELVYYVAIDRDNPMGALYRVPVLGGPPRKVLTHIACPVTFSPDGKQFAFFRTYVKEGYDALIVSNVEGNGERTLAVRKGNDWFEEDGPAWSPDGKTIACGIGTDTGGTYMTVVEVPVAGGEPKPITSQKWGEMGRVVWLGDGSGLIVIAAENLANTTSGTNAQIWHIAYPGGETRKITNDLSGYSHTSLGLTSDSRSLVVAQEDTSARISLTTLDRSAVVDTEADSQITAGKFDGRNGLSWMHDGRIVYVTKVGDDEDVWIMNGDGTAQTQLTDDAAIEETPIVSPDERHIYFTSTRTGTQHIWRMDVDGSHPKQMTEGTSISYDPNCSPDGRWVAFSSWKSGALALWKVSSDGGEPVRLTESPAIRAVFSPEGKFISCWYFDEQAPRAQWRVAIIPSEGGRPVRMFDFPYQSINSLAGIWWTPDSRALIYVDTPHGVSNVWSQPVDGGSPKQLTHFNTGQIFNLALTRDGRRLALARGGVSGDVVLITNFK